ncbi:hypothetical protein EGW08_016285 [Elysia chlorotica]|uniref:Uncharacterized protein n=1 Tax=Elysia chlorotica TaxID=188477 RepID=A0A433T318_ELYCH|nr:hypothetical protein EGW08_016285 [Elysia chlorotica]
MHQSLLYKLVLCWGRASTIFAHCSVANPVRSTNSTSIMKAVVAVLCLALMVIAASAQEVSPLVQGCSMMCGQACDVGNYLATKSVPFLGDILTTLDTLCDQVCGLVCGLFAMAM